MALLGQGREPVRRRELRHHGPVHLGAGETDHALLIDCRSLETGACRCRPASAVVVMDTGARRALAASAYNDRRAACQRAVAADRSASESGTSARCATSVWRRISPAARTAARRRPHVEAREPRGRRESRGQRATGFDALGRRRPRQAAGRLMDESHASLRDLYQRLVPGARRNRRLARAARSRPAPGARHHRGWLRRLRDSARRRLRRGGTSARRCCSATRRPSTCPPHLPLPPRGRRSPAGVDSGHPVETTCLSLRFRTARHGGVCDRLDSRAWLPILVASVLVFVASNIVRMALPHHKSDAPACRRGGSHRRAGRTTSAGLPPLPVGRPMAEMKDPAFVDKLKGPVGLLTVLPADPSTCAARSARDPLPRRDGRHGRVRHGPRARSGRLVPRGLPRRPAPSPSWRHLQLSCRAPSRRGKPLGVALKEILDGLAYVLVTAGAFGWLWPR